ncbi:19655_t:CDS:2 [Rhizophagus irregularis]|nr:19655_t:CDS:2 [Rhizophagus irregularis]
MRYNTLLKVGMPEIISRVIILNISLNVWDPILVKRPTSEQL